jgi:hypothetical protein
MWWCQSRFQCGMAELDIHELILSLMCQQRIAPERVPPRFGVFVLVSSVCEGWATYAAAIA